MLKCLWAHRVVECQFFVIPPLPRGFLHLTPVRFKEFHAPSLPCAGVVHYAGLTCLTSLQMPIDKIV